MTTIAEAMGQGNVVAGEVAPVVDEQQAADDRTQALARIDALGQSLARTRAEAIAARQASGIEDEWLEDEEFYQGIDDANRGESKYTWRKKPPGQAMPDDSKQKTTRSTVFPNITRPYCDSAAARIADMLLPTDDRAWSLSPTPIPEAEGAANGEYSPQLRAQVEGKYPDQPELQQKEMAIATQAAMQVIAEAKVKADKAQTRIEDWHVECQFHGQARQVIEDAARVGAGILKGPVPMSKHRVGWNNAKRQMTIARGEIKPGSKWIDYWNFYPDAACGESIHNGAYTWERDHLTRKQLRDLRTQEGYIPEQIALCLEEGPMNATGEYKPTPDGSVNQEEQNKKHKFEVWYFHGTAEKEDLEAAGVDIEGIADPHIPCMVVMVNNRVIKVAQNPLDTGDFPYDVMVWQRRAGHWAGIGVARQIRVPQRIVIAATRNLMDNAGLAAGVMLVLKQGVIRPADGVMGIAPRKIWYIAEDAEGMEDATKAIGQIKVDMLVTELMEIIQLGLKLAEDVTGLPMLLQGQQGDAPDTLGGQQLVSNNASAVLRRLARLFDDRVTEPHVRRYYVWLLQYGEEDEKGDYCIDARGSSALVERDIQNQELAQMGSIVLDPRFGLDPRKWVQEYLKSRHFDPKRFEFDDDKWKQILESMSQGKSDPRMAIAQLNAQLQEKLTQLEQSFTARENERDRQLQYIVKELELESNKDVSVGSLKTKLADTILKLRTQERLSVRDNATKIASKPPTEPVGRARRGQAYEA